MDLLSLLCYLIHYRFDITKSALSVEFLLFHLESELIVESLLFHLESELIVEFLRFYLERLSVEFLRSHLECGHA